MQAEIRAAIDIGGETPFYREHGISALRMMMTIREFEKRLPGFSAEGLLRGSTHPSVGMEAVAVGTSVELTPSDWIASNHRGHGHCLAKGADAGRMLAEIFGRVDGYCEGKGGSMHLGVKSIGLLGANGVVGAGIGLATGAALASQIQGTGSVAVAYFGDGATNQGVLGEAFNLAAIWKLPVVFLCENNHYAQSAAIEEMVAETQLTKRGPAFGVPSFDVDGMDVVAVNTLMKERISAARNGEGPSFVVADTYRYLGHMAGDTEIYRDQIEVVGWHEKDPIVRLSRELTEAGLLSEQERVELEAEVAAHIDQAEAFARQSPFPDVSTATTDVYQETA